MKSKSKTIQINQMEKIKSLFGEMKITHFINKKKPTQKSGVVGANWFIISARLVRNQKHTGTN